MSRFVDQFDMYLKAHEAFKNGNNAEGLKAALFLMANGVVKLNSRQLYKLWESSVYGGQGSEELFLTMLDQGMIPEILRNAKAGEFEVLKDFVDAVARLNEDTRYEVLKACLR
jgi:hypothetical protein